MLAALNSTEVGAIHSGVVRQHLLGDTALRSVEADRASKCDQHGIARML